MTYLKEYKLVAPDIDRLLLFFDRGYINPSIPSKALVTAMEPLFSMLSDLAPMENNEEVKTIWLQIPRGSMDDYDRYEDLLEYGEIKTREEYEARWFDDYPDEVKWYRLVLVESHNRNQELSFRGVSLDNKMIISAELDRNEGPSSSVFTEEAAVALCALIAKAAAVSMGKVRKGTYNEDVNAHLPYWFRTGVIKRNILWENDSAWKENALDGLSAETVTEFRKLLDTGANEPDKIGRITSFTANDFFRACACGYRALDYDCGTLSPSELYLRYADGRDEGLTGTGHGLNEGPGIDFNDPAAWDVWFFSQRGGGHPWEVVRGGNSTHVDLFVCHDKEELEWKYRTGKINEAEYHDLICKSGYYFSVRGKHRPKESVTFYTALSAAGLPVILEDADEIMARFDGSDYIGIVPHHVLPKYCEELFPATYGHVIDFMHVYKEDLETIGEAIEWLPMEEAKLVKTIGPCAE